MSNFNYSSIEDLLLRYSEEDTLIKYKDFIINMDLDGIKRNKSTQQYKEIPHELFIILRNKQILLPAMLGDTMGPNYKDIYFTNNKKPYALYPTSINNLKELINELHK